ncbi:MAG: TetR/AcrR family transcriptional regulator [Cycloclasticus pugetii]|jgi:AcrR family transcriptional regulator|uniref:TetR family transcriptional regulator n=1 Tax=Cycloclasticus zancles 78-ME TaxID=1198232 RepID=S5TGH4_9GAMM|nr:MULTISPECIES: TetR/AcrR family transcriptional regulator [Cycloclasticus]AFT67000.1 Transcriptional regulator, TetR family [Cycloclasticus sp. P1]AGS39967.1 TetR family transcriptional regulator [Cycloclasticus zancles 78-ME]SHJ32705.1 transcriptional regulator, TetR family [Cycloclasticus pugetii]|tara:strand:- start:2033 stop:2629 length:597 start_codon:yes stop_codon:yes gene_type:complete
MKLSKGLDKKNKIFDVALTLFSKYGFKAVTMREIAAKSSTSLGSLYIHYKSKAELYDMVLDSAYLEHAKAWRVTSDPDETLESKLYRFINNFCHFMNDNVEVAKLFKREQLDADPKRIKKLAEKVLSEEYNNLKELVIEANPTCHADVTTVLIFGMALNYYETMEFRKYFPGYDDSINSPDFIAEQIFNMAIAGLKST